MADRILGLMGPGEGPLVCTRDLGDEPVAKITGLTEGGKVSVQVTEDFSLVIRENGHHRLPASHFMRVRCEVGSPHMICTLLSGRKRAVS